MPTDLPRHSTFSDNQADRSLDIEGLTSTAKPKTVVQGNPVTVPTRGRWSVSVVANVGYTTQVGQGANAQKVNVSRNSLSPQMAQYDQNTGDLKVGTPMCLGRFTLGRGDCLSADVLNTGSTPTPRLSATDLTIIIEATL